MHVTQLLHALPIREHHEIVKEKLPDAAAFRRPLHNESKSRCLRAISMLAVQQRQLDIAVLS